MNLKVSRRGRLASSAFASSLVLVAASLAVPWRAEGAIFNASGRSLIVSSPDWTLMSSIADNKGDGVGVFINGTNMFTFAPTKNKNKPGVKKDGTTKATTLYFRKLALTPATVVGGNIQAGSATDSIVVSISVKVGKGGKLSSQGSMLFNLKSKSFPYSISYSGSPTLYSPSNKLAISGKPTIKVGRTKAVKLSTIGATISLATTGAASAVCADGYGGSTAKSGCAPCPAGSFGLQLEASTACKSCKSLGPQAYSAQGATTCTNCTGTQLANTNATACLDGGTPSTGTTFPLFILTAEGLCKTINQVQLRENQEAFMRNQSGVQSANATITCSEFQGRRRRNLLGIFAGNRVTIQCLGDNCTAAFASLVAKAQACCGPSKPACQTGLAPPNCISASQPGTKCGTNQYLKRGANCTTCGDFATSTGDPALTCVCNGTTAIYNTTSDKCVCPDNGVYDAKAGCSSCTDKVRNGNETDVDCGGSICVARCGDGQGCREAGDCSSGVCNMTSRVCLMATCTDQVKNGNETDVDCGGIVCSAKCAEGQGCISAADCATGVCNSTSKACAMEEVRVATSMATVAADGTTTSTVTLTRTGVAVASVPVTITLGGTAVPADITFTAGTASLVSGNGATRTVTMPVNATTATFSVKAATTAGGKSLVLSVTDGTGYVADSGNYSVTIGLVEKIGASANPLTIKSDQTTMSTITLSRTNTVGSPLPVTITISGSAAATAISFTAGTASVSGTGATRTVTIPGASSATFNVTGNEANPPKNVILTVTDGTGYIANPSSPSVTIAITT